MKTYLIFRYSYIFELQAIGNFFRSGRQKLLVKTSNTFFRFLVDRITLCATK